MWGNNKIRLRAIPHGEERCHSALQTRANALKATRLEPRGSPALTARLYPDQDFCIY